MFDRITFDPHIMGGRACIRGMRIPVSVVVGQIAHGASFDEVLAGYPDLERQDIEEALRYAACAGAGDDGLINHRRARAGARLLRPGRPRSDERPYRRRGRGTGAVGDRLHLTDPPTFSRRLTA